MKESDLIEMLRRGGATIREDDPNGDMVIKLPDPPSKADVRAEKQLQADCEGILSVRGYQRLTAHNAATIGDRECLGWFGHLAEAKRNPLMPDLFIFSESTHDALLVELKVRDHYQPGQREMIQRGCWLECRSVDEFRRALNEWEAWQ